MNKSSTMKKMILIWIFKARQPSLINDKMTEQHKQTTQDQIFDPGITFSNASSSSHQINIEIDNNNNILKDHSINNNTENSIPSNQQFSVLGSTFTIATNNVCGLSALTK